MLLRAGNLLRRRIISAKLTVPALLADHTQQCFNWEKLMDLQARRLSHSHLAEDRINQVIIWMTNGITKKTIKEIYNEASHYLHNPHNKKNTLIFFGLSF